VQQFLENFRAGFVVLLILSFVTAGISPACAFVSGHASLIEICAADGTMKTVSLTETQTGLKASPALPQDKPHKNQECQFCFTASAGALDAPQAFVLSAPLSADVLMIGAGSAIQKSAQATPFEATGPPFSSSL